MVAGLATGFLLAAAGARFLGSLVHGVSPADPVTFAGIGILLAAVGYAAAYLPARRATSTDPAGALRHD